MRSGLTGRVTFPSKPQGMKNWKAKLAFRIEAFIFRMVYYRLPKIKKILLVFNK
jgi:hypothetical protein